MIAGLKDTWKTVLSGTFGFLGQPAPVGVLSADDDSLVLELGSLSREMRFVLPPSLVAGCAEVVAAHAKRGSGNSQLLDDDTGGLHRRHLSREGHK